MSTAANVRETRSFLGTNVGYGDHEIREFYGRRAYSNYSQKLGIGAVGLAASGRLFEGIYVGGVNLNPGSFQYIGVVEPPIGELYRVGADLWVGAGYAGLYVNPFEIIDLVAGLVGLDPANDSGLPLGYPTAEAEPADGVASMRATHGLSVDSECGNLSSMRGERGRVAPAGRQGDMHSDERAGLR